MFAFFYFHYKEWERQMHEIDFVWQIFVETEPETESMTSNGQVSV